MSATLAAALYQEYFGIEDQPPIQVGARRFPVQEIFLEDMIQSSNKKNKKKKQPPPVSALLLSNHKVQKQAEQLLKECLEMKCQRSPSMAYMEQLYSVAAHLAMSVGTPGKSSVLIFVPGMNDIVAITELIESAADGKNDVTVNCFPIHSDIPFEDQMVGTT
jgi:HrpA-like RNA helicase